MRKRKTINQQTGQPAGTPTDVGVGPTGKRANRQTGKQKIRIKFTKGEEVRYISHLDMVRAFTRAMRRAGLPIATTCGFVSRERISFSPPLSLGLTSKSEYADIELVSFVSPQRFQERLDRELPPGLEIKGAEIVPLKSRSLMATFDCAEYEIKLSVIGDQLSPTLRSGQAVIRERIKEFLAQSEIIIKRETKKGIKEINIRPLVLKLELRDLISGNQRSIDPRSKQYKEIRVLRMLLRIKIRPQEVVKTLLNLSREETLKLAIERKDLLKI